MRRVCKVAPLSAEHVTPWSRGLRAAEDEIRGKWNWSYKIRNLAKLLVWWFLVLLPRSNVWIRFRLKLHERRAVYSHPHMQNTQFMQNYVFKTRLEPLYEFSSSTYCFTCFSFQEMHAQTGCSKVYVFNVIRGSHPSEMGDTPEARC